MNKKNPHIGHGICFCACCICGPFRTVEEYFARGIWGSVYDFNGPCAGPGGPLAHCRSVIG